MVIVAELQRNECKLDSCFQAEGMTYILWKKEAQEVG